MAQILGNQQSQPQFSLDWSQAQDFNCSNCGGEYFINAVTVKKFSKLVTGTPKDAIIPVDILLCGNCGKVVEELIPTELRKKPKVENKEEVPTQPPVENTPSLTLEL